MILSFGITACLKSTLQDVLLLFYLNKVFIVGVQDILWSTVTISKTNNLISGITLCYFILVTCSGNVGVFVFCGCNGFSMLLCFQYICLWILVICHDVAVIGLCGQFTQIMQYRVGTECVHAWTPSALWCNHTQLQTHECVRLQIVIISHTHTVISNVFRGHAIVLSVADLSLQRSGFNPRSVRIGFVVDKKWQWGRCVQSTSVFPCQYGPSVLHTYTLLCHQC